MPANCGSGEQVGVGLGINRATRKRLNGLESHPFTADSVPSLGRSYTLTQGAEFTDAMLDSGTSPDSYFKLATGTRGKLSVENGELVYTAPGFYITVR